jgi:hypothetical protein
MKNTLLILVLSVFAIGAAQAADFTLSGPTVKEGATLTLDQVYKGFGCSGKNISPALSWSGAPEGTKSFAVTVYDPDAPTGSGWWHWLIYNIPANVNALAENAGNPKSGKAPKGSVQALTDFGSAGFGGACPPVGDKPHRYIFTVFALKTDKLSLPKAASAAMVGYNLNGNSLAKASFTAMYGR